MQCPKCKIGMNKFGAYMNTIPGYNTWYSCPKCGKLIPGKNYKNREEAIKNGQIPVSK